MRELRPYCRLIEPEAGSEGLLRKLLWDATPKGVRPIFISIELLESLGTRTEDGDKITAEWGEPDKNGFYTPVFTRHADEARRNHAEALAAVVEAARVVFVSGADAEESEWTELADALAALDAA